MNIIRNDNSVDVRTINHENHPVTREKFYVLTPRKDAGPNSDDNELDYLREMFDAKVARRISGGNFIIVSPNRYADQLVKLPETVLWPYAICRGTALSDSSAQKIAKHKHRIGGFPLSVLYWGLIFDYHRERQSFVGIYFSVDGKPEIYGPELLVEGIKSFMERMSTCHIAVTNDDFTQKLQIIAIYMFSVHGNRPDSFDTTPFDNIVHTSIRELSSLEYPGVNWEFPDAVEKWFIKKGFLAENKARTAGRNPFPTMAAGTNDDGDEHKFAARPAMVPQNLNDEPAYSPIRTSRASTGNRTGAGVGVAAGGGFFSTLLERMTGGNAGPQPSPNHIECKEIVDLPHAPLKWHTDFIYRKMGLSYVESEWVRIYAMRLFAFEAMAHPMIISRINMARGAQLDFRSSIVTEEIESYARYGMGIASVPREPNMIFNSPMRRDLNHFGKTLCVFPQGQQSNHKIIQFYAYDIGEWCRMKGISLQSGFAAFSHIRSKAVLTEIAHDNSIVALFGGGLVTCSKITELEHVFVSSNLVFGFSGIAFFAGNETYGYGLHGTECATSRAYRTSMRAHFRGVDVSEIINNEFDSSYDLMINSRHRAAGTDLCTPNENFAILKQSISVPLVAWKDRDGKYVRDYSINVAMGYVGLGSPNFDRLR